MTKWITGMLALAWLVILAGCAHPWFKNRWPWDEQPDPDLQAMMTDNSGRTYHRGTPSWVPLIDGCMEAGGTRAECIAALPPEELARLEAWEAEQGARRRSQMALRRTADRPAESRASGLFLVDLPQGWLVGPQQPGEAGWSHRLTATHPAGTCSLQFLSLVTPAPFSREQLRNLTNVDSAVALRFEQWGDYRGFQYDYLERTGYFRQWWLARGDTIVLVTYQCPSEFEGVETERIDAVVRSLRAINPE